MGSVVAGSKRPLDHENDLNSAFPNKRMFRDRSFSDCSSSSNNQEPGKESSTIPIFLKKTYKIIETCDGSIAGWTEDGEMFTVTNPDKFAATIIPQFFDHNKFSSFARQLNFYGFRKVQSKPKRSTENEVPVTKGVTFYNPNFKRGRVDLLRKITRSTRGGTSSSPNPLDHQKEVASLKSHIAKLEQKIDDMSTQLEERAGRIQLEVLSQIKKILSVNKLTVPAPQPVRSLSSSTATQQITSEWDSSTEAQAAALAFSAPHPATPSPPPSSHQASQVMSHDMAPLSLNQSPTTEDAQGHFPRHSTWEECFFKEFMLDAISCGPGNGHAEGQ
jgi:hypothetical protein